MTQNIDNLEIKAGIKKNKLVQCHGAIDGAHCAVCKETKDQNELKQKIKNGEVMYCESGKCKGKMNPVKHKVVFHGESLPDAFVRA